MSLKKLINIFTYQLALKLKHLPFWDEIVIKNCKILNNNRHFFGRFISHLFWKEYYTRSLQKRTYIQSKLMGGTAGSDWAKYYDQERDNFPPKNGDQKIGALEFNEGSQGITMIEDLLKTNPNLFTVIQLGGSSGKEISYLAKNFLETNFIYTDLFESVTAYASKKLKISNLDYVTCPAESLPALAQACKSKKVLIFSIGSSQYVFPEHLDYFFRLLSKVRKKEIDFIIDEPGNNQKINPINFEGSLPRGLFSYTHNYKYYAEKNGFTTKRWDYVEPFLPKERFKPYLHNTIKLFGWFNLNRRVKD